MLICMNPTPYESVKVLYEDDHILALNKPAGLVMHSDGRTEEETLTECIAHRLDRDTSGVVLVAKDEQTFDYLRSQFNDRKVRKVYRGIVWGTIKDDMGTIDRKIGRSKKHGVIWSVATGAKGTLRDAVTKWRVLKRGNGFTYMEYFPMTGRTHQIRVHMKSTGHPLVSDKLYGAREGRGLGLERTALHAASISFVQPNGKELKIEAPLPDDMVNAVKELETIL
jgi:23S rRNA pseudouridine1911/1915/1917 synthase